MRAEDQSASLISSRRYVAQRRSASSRLAPVKRARVRLAWQKITRRNVMSRSAAPSVGAVTIRRGDRSSYEPRSGHHLVVSGEFADARQALFLTFDIRPPDDSTAVDEKLTLHLCIG